MDQVDIDGKIKEIMKADNPVRETGGCRIYLIVMAICVIGIILTMILI